MQVIPGMLESSLPSFSAVATAADLPPELAELQVKAQAAEIEAMARWTYESRLADMGETIVVFDAKRRASRWSNDQPSKYRKVAYLFGFLVNYSTHQKDASWEWLAKQVQAHPQGHDLAEDAAQARQGDGGARPPGDHREHRRGPRGVQLFPLRAPRCPALEHVHHPLRAGRPERSAAWSSTTGTPRWRTPRPRSGSAECKRCGAGFDPKRKDARYCSARCRKAASREDVTDNDQRG